MQLQRAVNREMALLKDEGKGLGSMFIVNICLPRSSVIQCGGNSLLVKSTEVKTLGVSGD